MYLLIIMLILSKKKLTDIILNKLFIYIKFLQIRFFLKKKIKNSNFTIVIYRLEIVYYIINLILLHLHGNKQIVINKPIKTLISSYTTNSCY